MDRFRGGLGPKRRNKAIAPYGAVLYLTATALAFVAPWAAQAIYVGVALMWLIPDRRIEKVVRR
jgi:hypothetical protein